MEGTVAEGGKLGQLDSATALQLEKIKKGLYVQ